MPCCDKLIAAAEKSSPCECAGPGFCERHHCTKPAHFHLLCKTRLDYFLLWERGEGPCMDEKSRVLCVGTALAWLIRKLTFGYPPLQLCTGCKSRAAWLDRTFPCLPLWWRNAS